jgi:hypothetical protein
MTDPSETNTIALLGTGIMGSAMARRLLGAGFTTRVWNRTRDKAEPLGADGAVVLDSPGDAVAGAAVGIAMLTDSGVVAEVVVASAAKDAGLIVDAQRCLGMRSPRLPCRVAVLLWSLFVGGAGDGLIFACGPLPGCVPASFGASP